MSSLYRKWRSRSFDDLLGQDHVVRTLRNAVAQGRVAHAYLFTGPRGTGKTSTARLLAKAVNCLTPRQGNACNECEMCVAANEGRVLDVIEIDAASNTSVENVRELRERVGYAAGEARYKVYIIDEVHRLSGAAFDAFLKTLEEPPPHVVFVFASTEPHKVPATIMSRCQRFDFRRISPQVMFERVQFVASQESIDTSVEALQLIAQAANGSLRDGLGLLDQVASYTEGRIGAPEVRQALGLTDPTLVGRLTQHLLDGEIGAGLGDIESFLEAGGDAGQLTRQLIEYWRALLLRGAGGPDAAAIDPALAESLPVHASRVGGAEVVAVLRALTEQDFSAKYNLPPELPLEVGYVQAGVALMRVPARTETRPASRPASASALPPAPDVPSAPTPAAQSVTRETTAKLPETPAERPSAPASDSATRADLSDMDTAWANIVRNMRSHSRSLEALLKSGYLMRVADGELTVGFLHDFHRNQFTDVKKRRLLEEVVGSTLGTAYRVNCVKVSREEVESARGEEIVDDGFVEEAAERIRALHLRQLGNGHS